MKFINAFIILILSYFLYGFYLSSFNVDVFPSRIHHQHPEPFYDYKGVTNVYSQLSLGSGDIKEIVTDAKAANLDFIFITDLNIFENNIFVDGYHDNLLLLSAQKFSYLDSRLLFYSSKKVSLGQNLGDLNLKVTDLLSQNSDSNKDFIFILTHPFMKGFGWTGELPNSLDGIELINFKRVQQKHFEEEKADSFLSLLMYPFNPALGFIRLFDEPVQELQMLDAQQSKKFFTASLGLEATAKAVPFTGSTIHFPSYETIFRLGSQHILLRSELTGQVQNDKQKILKALKSGEYYLCLDVLGNPKGFNTFIKTGEQIFLMGNAIPFKRNLIFNYQLPKPLGDFEVIVYKDGAVYKKFSQSKQDFPILEKGIYRLEVRLKLGLPFPMKARWIPWIYTNSFYIN